MISDLQADLIILQSDLFNAGGDLIMSTFEQIWYDKYMNNHCTASTLIKLANAGKLDEVKVNEWIAERQEKLNY